MVIHRDDEYEIPLVDQRYFGAGIKRKRIQFVQSKSTEKSIPSLPSVPSSSVADRYREVVLRKTAAADGLTAAEPTKSTLSQDGRNISTDAVPDDSTDSAHIETTCDICNRPITASDSTAAHQQSIAHQVCLQHSFPPSHLDRRRRGLAVLESQGWDPDGRRGLGAEGEGILHPIKAKEKPNRAGLGMKLGSAKAVEKPVRLDAGKVRMMETEGKKKAARLRNAFYRNQDVARYLGE